MSDQYGFGPGFSKEIEAILRVWDTGELYGHELRANLAKAGLLIGMEVALPDVELPEFEPAEDDYQSDEAQEVAA